MSFKTEIYNFRGNNNGECFKQKQAQSIDYHAIEAMESFNSFVKKKNTFLFSITAVFLILYILLPILAFQPVLQQKFFGNITGVWVYSAGLFIMTIVLCTVYVKKLLHSIKLQPLFLQSIRRKVENK